MAGHTAGDFPSDSVGVSATVRNGSGQKLMEYDREAVHVSRWGDVPAVELLAGHVSQRSDARVARAGLCGRLGDSEVSQQRIAVMIEKNICGLDVTVDDPIFVGIVKGISDL